MLRGAGNDIFLLQKENAVLTTIGKFERRIIFTAMNTSQLFYWNSSPTNKTLLNDSRQMLKNIECLRIAETLGVGGNLDSWVVVVKFAVVWSLTDLIVVEGLHVSWLFSDGMAVEKTDSGWLLLNSTVATWS